MDFGGKALVQHAIDGSVVTAENPARAGEELVAFAINLGPVKQVPPSGVAAQTGPESLVDILGISSSICAGYDRVLIGSSAVEPTYEGLAPGLIGIYQIQFKVPAGSAGQTQMLLQRTIATFPFGACQPDRQTVTSTVASAPAILDIQ